MSFWKRVFGQCGISPEERRQRIDETDVERVSCMDVVRMIRNRVAKFSRSKGMVVLLLEGCKVQMYFFDGVSRTSWGYNNHQFSTDRVGQTFLVGPPTVVALNANTEHLLADVVRKAFPHCDTNVAPLWKLDPTARDYQVMLAMHGGDISIRLSFDELPPA